MSNISLNDTYDIEFGSTWKNKDGVRCTALSVEHAFKKSKVPIVGYSLILTDDKREEFLKNKKRNLFVKTVYDFKEEFQKIKG